MPLYQKHDDSVKRNCAHNEKWRLLPMWNKSETNWAEGREMFEAKIQVQRQADKLLSKRFVYCSQGIIIIIIIIIITIIIISFF